MKCRGALELEPLSDLFVPRLVVAHAVNGRKVCKGFVP
jgi:hypothetical protein